MKFEVSLPIVINDKINETDDISDKIVKTIA